MNGSFVYLAQTDTTVGLLSQDKEKLNKIKGRLADQKIIRAVCDLAALRAFARVPIAHRNLVRRARQTTFVYPNGEAIRLIFGEHRSFFETIKWAYSTSANKTGERFDIEWARAQADAIVIDRRGLFEAAPSKMYRLGKMRSKKIR
ncbi:MAG: Sua5 YciO YrdC YwlC family protein [Helicobacteraceae bacterium]|jgi:tRNA A37 threonylcarbamoyladenosine synthetase subunit TsaC/SUA5/YrdC|nr:Sua5 YciO YrdC YwlC family protein [Helicobacteraceae bacterium]